MLKKTILPYFNRKAKFKYEFKDSLSVGLVLNGLEVKKIVVGDFDITNSFCFITNKMEIFLENFIIGSTKRPIKLLAHKKEIIKLEFKKKQFNATIIPYKIFFKFNKIKLEIFIAIGKKIYQKKQRLIEIEKIKEINKLKKK